MASIDDCEAALSRLGAALDDTDHHLKKHANDRTVSCRVPDLGVTFCGELADGRLVDIRVEDRPEPAQIRLTVASDDLVALVDGELPFAHAWATGRVKLDASLRDLLRLRSMLG
jgi:predicted lipid carrier protein YhbT